MPDRLEAAIGAFEQELAGQRRAVQLAAADAVGHGVHTARMSDVIRALARPELDIMVDWAAAEGWNPGVHDADAFFATDPEAFSGLDVDGELAVTLSVVRYDDSFAFVGFYICRPELRGRGLGIELLNADYARADATTLGLDGVARAGAQLPRPDGFVTAHHSVRYGGVVDLTVAHDDVRVLGAADVDALLDFERGSTSSPHRGGAFLERWITAPGTDRVAVGDGRIRATASCGACCEGQDRPAFCADRATAQRLLAALVAHVDGGPVFLDVPVPNTEGSAMARDLGLEPVFETARMYRGPDPDLHLDRSSASPASNWAENTH